MLHVTLSDRVISHNVRRQANRSLARDCSIAGKPQAIDAAIARSPRTAVGRFRCPVDHSMFRDSGPITDCIIVFPRTSVWIRHDGSRPFLADPSIVTIYNRAQRYERYPLSPEGDHCDWFAVSDDLAREIAATVNPSSEYSDRPFGAEWAPSSARLYLRQRSLFRRAMRGEVDALELDEQVMDIVAEALAGVSAVRSRRLASRASAVRRRRDLAEAARAELARSVTLNRSVRELASVLGTSPFHLCRVFQLCTGRTMHEYRTELRLRRALELLELAPASPMTISTVAHRVGFASHSHFVRATTRGFGLTPSAIRRAMA